jgi:hypothetical protein
MTTTNTFHPAQFRSTRLAPAEHKARLANALVGFIDEGCPRIAFTDELYRLCASTFGHHREEGREEFYERWFATPEARLTYLVAAMNYQVGPPDAGSWADLEHKVQLELAARSLAPPYARRVHEAAREELAGVLDAGDDVPLEAATTRRPLTERLATHLRPRALGESLAGLGRLVHGALVR